MNEISRASFTTGHPKMGGRRRRPTALAREICERLGVDPLEYLVKMLATKTYELVSIGPRGAETRTKQPVPLEMQIDIAKTLSQYLHPKLSAVAVTGSEGGPIETGSISTTILMSPDLVDAMQKIAFAAAEADASERAEQRALAPPSARSIDVPYTAE